MAALVDEGVHREDLCRYDANGFSMARINGGFVDKGGY